MWSDVRKIVALAWPVLIGQLAIIAFGVIDTVESRCDAVAAG